MVDHNTKKKMGLNFARLLIEVGIDTRLPDTIFFRNEKGNLVEQKVQYDWKPTLYKACKKYGHSEVDCRKKAQAQAELSPKKQQDTESNNIAISEDKKKHDDNSKDGKGSTAHKGITKQVNEGELKEGTRKRAFLGNSIKHS